MFRNLQNRKAEFLRCSCRPLSTHRRNYSESDVSNSYGIDTITIETLQCFCPPTIPVRSHPSGESLLCENATFGIDCHVHMACSIAIGNVFNDVKTASQAFEVSLWWPLVQSSSSTQVIPQISHLAGVGMHSCCLLRIYSQVLRRLPVLQTHM